MIRHFRTEKFFVLTLCLDQKQPHAQHIKYTFFRRYLYRCSWVIKPSLTLTCKTGSSSGFNNNKPCFFIFCFQADDQLVRHTLKLLANHVQSLSLNSCYWLSASTLDKLARCRGVTHLDVTGCRLTSLCLSRLLSSLSLLRSLAFDVRSCFNSALLSSEAVDSLSRLTELRQTLFTPSYGVVPCCAQLRK